jgi:hypothetical protein
MARTDFLDSRTVRKSPTPPTGTEPCRLVAVGDTIISEQGLVAVIERDPRYHVGGAAPTFEEANKVVWIPRTRPMHITGLR